MNSGLEGKVVLITGASGGIGAATARKFAEEGARLILHYRSGRDRAEALRKELSGAEAIIVRADLTKESDVRHLFVTATKRFGRIDTFVANAGSWETRDVPLQEMSLKQWKSSPVDAVAIKNWKQYSEARDLMLARTHHAVAPWRIVRTDDKRLARVNLIRDILSRVHYAGKKSRQVQPDRAIAFEFNPDRFESMRLAR